MLVQWGEYYYFNKKVLLIVRRVNDHMVIKLSVDDVSCTDNQCQGGEAVEGWLWSFAVNYSDTVNLCKHFRVRRLMGPYPLPQNLSASRLTEENLIAFNSKDLY